MTLFRVKKALCWQVLLMTCFLRVTVISQYVVSVKSKTARVKLCFCATWKYKNCSSYKCLNTLPLRCYFCYGLRPISTIFYLYEAGLCAESNDVMDGRRAKQHILLFLHGSCSLICRLLCVLWLNSVCYMSSKLSAHEAHETSLSRTMPPCWRCTICERRANVNVEIW